MIIGFSSFPLYLHIHIVTLELKVETVGMTRSITSAQLDIRKHKRSRSSAEGRLAWIGELLWYNLCTNRTG